MSLLTRADKLLHPRVGEIWCLHRVVGERSRMPSNRVLEITPDYLEEMIRSYSQRGYSFVPLDTILDETGKRGINARKMVNVSFDDGFADVFTNAYPILKRYHVPFTVYLTSGFPDGTVRIWWVELERILLSRESVRLSDGTVYAADSQERKIAAYEAICRRIVEGPSSPGEEYRSLVTSSVCEAGLSAGLSLSWGQLREMTDSGLCSVGSHSVSHPMLSKVTREVAEREMKESKSRIESMSGMNVRHFSYPHSSFSDSYTGLLAACGYCSAALGYGGAIRRGCPAYKLNRVHVIQK